MSFLCTIASGSTGNAALLSHKSTHLLIDAGISLRRIVAALRLFDLKLSDLSAVIITHEHTDHVRGLQTLLRNTDIPVYLSAGTSYSLEKQVPCLHNAAGIFHSGDDFEIGEIGVETFATPHDAADSVGFRFCAGHATLGYVTDLGHVSSEVRRKLLGVECLFIESNHDLPSLLGGPYPEFLKHRIIGRRGHLSNEDCASLVVEAVRSGARRITLCHLSQQNNTPELALETTVGMLEKAGAEFSCPEIIEVAPPDIVGKPYVF